MNRGILWILGRDTIAQIGLLEHKIVYYFFKIKWLCIQVEFR